LVFASLLHWIRRYEVETADRETGEIRLRRIPANSAAEAQELVSQDMGVVVGKIRKVEQYASEKARTKSGRNDAEQVKSLDAAMHRSHEHLQLLRQIASDTRSTRKLLWFIFVWLPLGSLALAFVFVLLGLLGIGAAISGI